MMKRYTVIVDGTRRSVHFPEWMRLEAQRLVEKFGYKSFNEFIFQAMSEHENIDLVGEGGNIRVAVDKLIKKLKKI